MDPIQRRPFSPIEVAGAVVARGPLVVPSYSSRALLDVPIRKTMEKTRDFVAGPILVSAYDVEHHGIDLVGLNASLLIVDSGGYETWVDGLDHERLGLCHLPPLDWKAETYRRVLDRIAVTCPVLSVSYDRTDLSLSEQIDAAIECRHPKFGNSLLLKPRTGEALRIEALSEHVHRLDAFDVVGVTEKEIGSSFIERLVFVARLRRLLDERGVQKPLHVFGGLDPFMTPLYFLAGADVVDGLTWLRMAFAEDGARYLPSQAALTRPRSPLGDEQWAIRQRNFGRAIDIQTGVRRFLRTGDYSQLADNAWLCSRIESVHREFLDAPERAGY